MARHATLAGRGVSQLEIWASPEPTVARLGVDTWRDELAETGHESRDGDIDMLASLEIHATRYPVLWEKVAPRDPHELDFSWARRRLERLPELDIEPIVTLLHHGSGPRYTSLTDPKFPELFAAFAAAAAREFPWVRRWTPINEPLTTARFSALYGLWYPNARDDSTFGRAIVNETLAIAAAMEEIREAIPNAQLVLTEDLQGFHVGDPSASRYATFLRERAFLSVELLLGRVKPGHTMYSYLHETCGISTRLLVDVAASASVPALVGWNWYPHSERYLGNDLEELVDVPAIYVEGEAVSPRPLLIAAHERLGLPQALSEVHVHASEYERARFLTQRFDDAVAVQAAGATMVAVGAWAAFGSADWHSLLRRRENIVEDGVFTFAGEHGVPEETVVAQAVRSLARGSRPTEYGQPGWWERPDRFMPVHVMAARANAGIPDGFVPTNAR